MLAPARSSSLGTDRSVYRYLKTLKQAEVRASLNPERLQKYSVNAAIWLFVRDPNKLEEIEQEDLAAFCQASVPLKKAYEILQDFLSIVHQREGQRLDKRTMYSRAGFALLRQRVLHAV